MESDAEKDAAFIDAVEASLGSLVPKYLYDLARRGAAAGDLLEALKDVRASIAMATVASCECLTKTPDPSFHEGHCRYRMLETAARTLAAAIAQFEGQTAATQEKANG